MSGADVPDLGQLLAPPHPLGALLWLLLLVLLLLFELLHHVGHDVVDSPGYGDIDPGDWYLTCSLHLWGVKHGEIVSSHW